MAGQKIEIINSIRTAHPLISQEERERLAAQRYEKDIDPVIDTNQSPPELTSNLNLYN